MASGDDKKIFRMKDPDTNVSIEIEMTFFERLLLKSIDDLAWSVRNK